MSEKKLKLQSQKWEQGYLELNTSVKARADKYDPKGQCADDFPDGVWTGSFFKVSKNGTTHFILGSVHFLGRWYTRNIAAAVRRFVEENRIKTIYTETKEPLFNGDAGRLAWLRKNMGFEFEMAVQLSLHDMHLEWKGLEDAKIRKQSTLYPEQRYPALSDKTHQGYQKVGCGYYNCLGGQEIAKHLDSHGTQKFFDVQEDSYSRRLINEYRNGGDMSIPSLQRANYYELCPVTQCARCDDTHREDLEVQYRNKAWAPVLDREKTSSFVVCGDAHLFGSRNFLDYLKEKEWAVEKYKLPVPPRSKMSGCCTILR